jgi:hypothetical protein
MLGQPLLAAVGLAGLILVTCAPQSEHDGPEGMCSPVADGPSLLRAGACVVGTVDDTGNPTVVTLARCRAQDGLLRPCDESFATWCNAQGGDLEEEPPSSRIGPLAAVPCAVASGAHRQCDAGFIQSCDRENGAFLCFDSDCTSGTCQPPPTPTDLWCTHYQAACACDTVKSCDNLKKICKNHQCFAVGLDDKCTSAVGSDC